MKEKSKTKKDKDTSLSNVCFIKLNSLEDLGKNMLFTDISKTLFSIAEDKKLNLFIAGPKLKGTRLIFYYQTDLVKAKYLAYKPEDNNSKKILNISDKLLKDQTTVTQIPIIELKKMPYKEKKIENVTCINVIDYEPMVKMLIARAMDNESMGKVYMFNVGNTYFITSLSLLGSDDNNVLYYAEVKNPDLSKGFFQYDYSDDTISQTNTIGSTSLLYLSIIYLKEGFPFFKPE
ncbi:MAG: hypothetical protein M1538_03890 [Candidatus Marsarchaeota archaeon]|jgi:hypothetical protein|nr:hypothetical protein [Candidatus Marsarchaeota archaeon]